MGTATKKLTVWGPRHPGSPCSIVFECDTMKEAEIFSDEFCDRRGDLRMQDVFVRLGREGKIVARIGPCR